MRDVVVLVGVFAWLAAVLLRLYPQKKRLLAEFGQDKDYYFFRKLADDGHAPSRRLIRETWIFIGLAAVGGLLMATTK